MNPRDEDEAWRDIVDNYGDQPSVEGLDEPPARHEEPQVHRPGSAEDPDAWHPQAWEDEGRYVPPPAPPVPLAQGPRLLAWVGLFGSPAVLLLGLILGVAFPTWLSAVLVLAFVGGFSYLIATMSPQPRDPGDDGARI